MDRQRDTAEAWLIHGRQGHDIDLLAAMQFVLDDLRAASIPVHSAWLGGRGMRIAAAGLDLLVTLHEGAPPARTLEGAMRPALAGDGPSPDLTRVRLGRLVHGGARSLAVIVKRPAASPASAEDAGTPDTPDTATAADLAETALLFLRPLIEAGPPALVLWQPGGLILTAEELLRGGAALLTLPGDPETRFDPASPAPPARRPVPTVHPMRPAPRSRSDRAGLRSARRLFGTPAGRHPQPVAGIEPALAGIVAAMRAPPTAADRRQRLGRRMTSAMVMLMWCALLPALLTELLPRL